MSATNRLVLPCALVAVLLLGFPGRGLAQPEPVPSDDPPVAETPADRPAEGPEAESSETKSESPSPAGPPSEDKPAAEKPAEAEAKPADEIVLRDWLLLPRVGQYKRTIVALDPIDGAMATGAWKAPAEGDEVETALGARRKWRSFTAKSDGAVRGGEAAGGYAFATVDSPVERVMILHAQRHASVAVNGHWFTGDKYGYGWVRLPVLLKKGKNELLFHMAQPGFKARLVASEHDAYFLTEDATLPDLIEGQPGEHWAAVPVVNATNKTLRRALLTVTVAGREFATPLPPIPPLSVHKAGLKFEAPDAAASTERLEFAVTVPEAGPETQQLAATEVKLKRVAPTAQQARTFQSAIDGSVQAYAVLPASGLSASAEKAPGVILALHSDGVDHNKFAGYYQAKDWAHVVAPQNRRAYGFDWEDWGATDAMEALADAQAHYPHDRSRVYVTGHSMGGHGAWRLGVTHPDKFAAIGPSAGWASLWTYGARMPAYDNPTPVETMLMRAAAPCDTMKMIENLAGTGVYVLHGEKDRQVSVSQGRYLRARLGEFHGDFAYREKPGAGNWWGKQCCDWPDMMAFFKSRTLPAASEVTEVEFVTPDLNLASENRWVRIEGQVQQNVLSKVSLRIDEKNNAFRGTTENVAGLSLDVGPLSKDQPIRVYLDGASPVTIRVKGKESRVWLGKNARGRWAKIAKPPMRVKNRLRSGGFKSVFANNPILVYSTGGNKEENAWSLGKARYDAQSFWYLGNGTLEVVADIDFDASAQPGRNVVLYGNADINKALPALLTTSPVNVRKGRVSFMSHGMDRNESGEDLAALFVRPRPSSNATVAVIGGGGMAGMRLTNRIRYFFSGVSLPDVTVVGATAPVEGEYQVRAVGYFGPDWRIETGDITWRDTAL